MLRDQRIRADSLHRRIRLREFSSQGTEHADADFPKAEKMFLYLLIAAVTVMAAAGVKMTAGGARGTRGRAVNWYCLFAIALILILPAVFREETGNDYLRYVEFFHLASIDSYVPTEKGFNLLVKLIYTLCGYENYLLVFAVFAILTIVLMLTAVRQQAEDFLFSFFLFMMFGYYYQSFNTMRYYFALSIVMAATIWFIRKNYVVFVLLVLGASLFHKSALAALVLFPLAMHVWKLRQLAVVLVIGCAVTAFHEQVMTILLILYPSWEDTTDLAAGTSISWVNILRCAGGLILAGIVWYLNRAERSGQPDEMTADAVSSESAGAAANPGADLSKGTKTRGKAPAAPAFEISAKGPQEARALLLYVNAQLLGLGIHIFGWFIPEVSRITYYLTYTQIFLFPMLLARIPAKYDRLKKLFTAAVVLAAICYFAMFLRSCYGDTIKLLPYQSFLFHDLNLTPSNSIE